MLFFVIFNEGDVWVAMGLQRRVVAEGATLQEVRRNLNLTLKAYEENCEGTLERLSMAPAEYWEMFVEAIELGRTFDEACEDESQEDAYALRLAA